MMGRRSTAAAVVLAATVAAAIYHHALAWAAPGEELISLLFGSRAGLETVLPALAASKDAVTYEARDPGVPPLAWATLPAGDRRVSSHVLLQMRGYLLKSRTWDESKTFNAVAALDPRRFDPDVFIYGGSYLGSVASALLVARQAGVVTLANDRSYYLEHPDAMGRVYLAARMVSSLALTVLVGLCALVAARRGLVAAAVTATLLSMSPELLAASHIAKPHAFAVLPTIAALVVVLATDGRRVVAAGVLAGVGAGASIPYAVLAVALAAIVGVRRGWRPAAILLASAGVSYLATNPHVVLFPGRLLATIGAHSHEYGYGTPSLGRLYAFVRQLGDMGVGWGGLALAVTGAVVGDRRVRECGVVLLVVVLILGAAFGELRIGLVAVPVAAILAGFGAARLAVAIHTAPARLAVLVVLLAVQAPTWLAFGSLFAAQAAEADPAQSPVLRAGRWINDHVPAGSAVAFADSSGWTDDVPPFRFLDYSLSALNGPGADWAIVTGKCDDAIRGKTATLGLGGYVEAARFDACAGPDRLRLCNCSYQSALAVAVLRRAGERDAPPGFAGADTPEGHLDTGLGAGVSRVRRAGARS